MKVIPMVNFLEFSRNEVITNCLEAMQAIQVKGTHSYFKRTLAYYSDAYNMNNI